MTPHNQPKARQVLQALIGGVDPDTGQELPRDTVLNRPDVIRALLAALGALESMNARMQRRAQLPESVGKAWTDDEEMQLREEYQQLNMATADIAKKHGRTVRAIEARLERLGLLRQAAGSSFMTGSSRGTKGGER